jgi:hypothetical protein
MTNNEIKKYDFVDCLFIDMNVGRLLSFLYVIVEAYYPTVPHVVKQKKGLIKVTFNQILSLNLKKIEEFDFDINLPFGEGIDDVRANEIYSITCEKSAVRGLDVVLNSDFLQFELTCNNMEVVEIDKF